MFSRNELLDAIEELEDSPQTFQNIQKLATFYSIYDHLYGYSGYSFAEPPQEPVRQAVIGNYGDSEFLSVADGKDAQKLFEILDELMDTVKVLQPRLYDATLQRLSELL